MTKKCHQSQHLFGEIVDGEMRLNELGNIGWWQWVKSEYLRKEIFLDEFVIMPNHFHGIVFIERPDNTAANQIPDPQTPDDPANQMSDPVGTTGPLSLRAPQRKPGGGKRSLSSMAGGFKLKSTIKINQIRETPEIPVWQGRFHDQIIRNEAHLNNVHQYIQNNPANWATDSEGPYGPRQRRYSEENQ